MESITRKDKFELMKSIHLMHKLNIVHFDIKPDNIMYSPAQGKVVFIDFGLSELVEIGVGQRMKINFRGTLDCCSP